MSSLLSGAAVNPVRQRRERSGWQANLRGKLIYGAE